MCSLGTFPLPPTETTVCEWENQLLSLYPGHPDIRKYTETIRQYPTILIPGDVMKRQVSRENAKAAFIRQEAGLWSRVSSAWRESGFSGSLEELSASNEDIAASTWLQSLAKGFLWLLYGINLLPGSLVPNLMLSNEAMIAEFAYVANWDDSVVRCFAWHPYVTKCAVALRDDSIRIYSISSAVMPVLKHKQQKGIAHMTWKPYCASVLAVACQHCIVIWEVDPHSLITRPSASCVQVLVQRGHHPVTSLSWNPWGTVLLSGSAHNTSMMVWNVEMEESTPLRRWGGGGVSLICWSPDASLVFAATPSTMFRVWETNTWTCEVWRNLQGRCQAACWSPDSSVLLFAVKTEPRLYALMFEPSPMEGKDGATGGCKAAIPVADLSAILLQGVRIGGCVHSMDWDESGERLAVSFQNEEGRGCQPFIALFRTRLKPALEITPCGFIRGNDGEVPCYLCFQKNYKSGALLTVCWSGLNESGRIGYIPLHFIPLLPLSSGMMSTLKSFPDSLPTNVAMFSEM